MTANEILAAIPLDRRTPAVVALMTDAAKLGPDHCRCLVEWVRENFPRVYPAPPVCRCGARVSTMCPICSKCLEKEERR